MAPARGRLRRHTCFGTPRLQEPWLAQALAVPLLPYSRRMHRSMPRSSFGRRGGDKNAAFIFESPWWRQWIHAR